MREGEENPSRRAVGSWSYNRRVLLRGGIGAAGLALAHVPARAARAYARTNQFAGIDVYPLPDTRTASPFTEISFRGVPPAELGDVRVEGTRSGAHSGILIAHSDGQGASFIPDAPFEAEETVNLRVGAPLGPAASDAVSFRVVRPVSPEEIAQRREESDAEPRSFRSRPDLRPLPIDITTEATNTAPGLVFVGARFPQGQAGPLILDNNGEQVWFLPLGAADVQANDFRVQNYKGQPVLTWCEGIHGPGFGLGHFTIRDSSYQEIATVQVGNGYSGVDLHDFTISPEDTALICVYNRVRWDTSSVGGDVEDVVRDSIVQEIDIPTGCVLFEWHSLDHVGVNESYYDPPPNKRTSFDYFHINSIEVDDDGNLIVSGRNTWAAYKINRRTGGVIWRLAGKRSDFAMGEDADFAFQHDARVHPNGQLSFFDNTTELHGSGSPSRGIMLQLDTEAMTASLVYEIGHPTKIVSGSQGNYQVLPNGNSFFGWGSAPVFSEFDANGELVFNGRFPRNITSYRAFRFPWVGQPVDDPAIAAERDSSGDVTVYASWNGATEVAAWRVFVGPDPDQLEEIGEAARSGFETAITVQTSEHFFAAQAEDNSGRVLGRSPAIEVGT